MEISRRAEEAQEQQHLEETLAIVRSEKAKKEAELGIEDGQDKLVGVQDDKTNASVVALTLMRNKLRSLHQLRLSENSPYFARLDFTPDGESKRTYYVGRWGVIETPGYQVRVVDWRSPVANLYYSGQMGRVSYEAPDGGVEGDMSLKRMFTIHQGRLEAMFDTGLAGQEKYLEDALSQVTSSRLREVVTTIQAEQNQVIRFSPEQPLLVQGVAGSGKTTIALHRIAWVLYRLQQSLQPQQMMILAPNPLFLTYISRVLPDLGVEEVRQTTFPLLCKLLMGKQYPRIKDTPRLEQRLHMTKAERDALDDTLRRKGSLVFREKLLAWLAAFEQSAPPQTDVTFGGQALLSATELRQLFLVQQRHFPLWQRTQEIKKIAKKRVQDVSEALRDRLARLTEQRLEELIRQMPDGEERRARATKLVNSREQRYAELKKLEKTFLTDYDALWPKMDVCTLYAAFLDDLAAKDAEYAPLRNESAPELAKRAARTEDLPALLTLCARVFGVKAPVIKQVVIDEAQDVSPFAIKALRELVGHDCFTLVGDLMQGVHGDEGLRRWSDLSDGVFETQPTLQTLSTSYRSTMEIMELAFSIIRRHPVEGTELAKPVLRHGERPRLLRVKGEKERVAAIAAQVRAWQSEGYFSIAIIEKTARQAQRLHKLLPKELGATLLSSGDTAFEGGVQVMGASVVKGLEFDCVLVANVSEGEYPDDRFTARLLYVLCTRPLHRLTLACDGQPSAHLENAQMRQE